jgi:hypothetical protein
MTGQPKLDRFLRKNPNPRGTFFALRRQQFRKRLQGSLPDDQAQLGPGSSKSPRTTIGICTPRFTSAILPAKGKLLDDGVSALIDDLKASGLLASTLIVMMGEFGRTVTPINLSGGRDHYPQHFAFFAGGGVKGGKIIGSTTPTGADVADPGWSRNRYVYAEDVDWTTVHHDSLGRRFEYVPFASEDLYGPVHELWG